MAAGVLDGFLDRLARGLAAEALDLWTDRELIERLRTDRDPAAFEVVVRRHGPMVFRVCRRVLQNAQDAEDCFQATFLVLARNLRAVRNPAALASWLHGVALRTALRTRAGTAARARAERQAAPAAPPPDDMTWGELRGVLDAELARLPDRWRLPLVLCHLEGRTQDEAARQLGWPRITLRRRLDEARAALGRRLARRGFGPAAVAAGLLADCLTAGAVPPRLLDRTTDFVTATGRATAVPTHVAQLAEGVTHSMTTLVRLKVSVAVLAAGLLLAGGWMTPWTGPAQLAVAQEKGATTTPVPKTGSAPAERPKPVDLTGKWRLALPAGFEHDVQMDALPENRFRFVSRGLVFNGVYERKDGRLVMAEPADERQTGFEWEEKADGTLVLVKNSDAMSGTYEGAVLSRADGKKPAKPVVAPKPATVVKAPPVAPAGKVRVTGRVMSSEYTKIGGTLDRSIVYIYTGSKGFNRYVDPDTKKEAYSNTVEPSFAFDLPPGEYQVQCTGNGSRGAVFQPTYKTFTVKAGSGALDLGTIDMPAAKVTKLYGHAAPDLTGVVAWKNTGPLALKDLRGKVVVIDFFSYACSICHHYKPNLIKLADRYKDKGLVVIALHDNSVASVEEMDKEMESVVKHTWKGKPLGLPIGIDGKGGRSVFQEYGVHAVPTVLLIDADGKLVRRFGHAGAPDLETEVAKLLPRTK